MDFDDLTELNKEFAETTQLMQQEFLDLFKKWQKKSFRLATILSIHMPINIIMNLISLDKDNVLPRIVPELPEIMERFLKPFSRIKKHWGTISSKEFENMYRVEYEKQFTKFFFTPEHKEVFKKWFEKDQKKTQKE